MFRAFGFSPADAGTKTLWIGPEPEIFQSNMDLGVLESPV